MVNRYRTVSNFFHNHFIKSHFYETLFHDILIMVIKMSIMTQLEFELEFSDSEKEIARYILNHGDDVLSMSVKQLAQHTYTSPG